MVRHADNETLPMFGKLKPVTRPGAEPPRRDSQRATRDVDPLPVEKPPEPMKQPAKGTIFIDLNKEKDEGDPWKK